MVVHMPVFLDRRIFHRKAGCYCMIVLYGFAVHMWLTFLRNFTTFNHHCQKISLRRHIEIEWRRLFCLEWQRWIRGFEYTCHACLICLDGERTKLETPAQSCRFTDFCLLG